jgi:hypothetical protein
MDAHTTPRLISGDTITKLERLSFGSDYDFKYNEAWLQDFLFEQFQAIPVEEIDKTFKDMIPVCTELNTPAGPLDILYVTPEGKLVVLEAKLWRNPEARRKVVAQVIDYAKELSRWTYEDLQREVSKVTKRQGNVLYEIVKARYPDTDEADFVDEVTRTLKRGDFLLLIVGDGIREGTRNIAEFMHDVGRVQFTLALVEVAMFKMLSGDLLVQPRVLAKTTIIERTVIELKDERIVVQEQEPLPDTTSTDDRAKLYQNIWGDFLAQFSLDDPSVGSSSNPSAENYYLYPGKKSSLCWISAYFMKSKQRVGVYFRTQKSTYGERLFEFLRERTDEINAQLDFDVQWDDSWPNGIGNIGCSLPLDNLYAESNRAEIFQFFNKRLNGFVNVLKPLIKEFDELQ